MNKRSTKEKHEVFCSLNDLADVLLEERSRRGPPDTLPNMEESELNAYWLDVESVRGGARRRRGSDSYYPED